MTITPIRGEEAAKWAALQKTLIKPYRLVPVNEDQESPFVDSSWQLVAVGGSFTTAAWRISHETQINWPVRADLPDITTRLDPLFWCLKKRGVDEVIISLDWDRPAEPANKSITDPALFYRCPLDAEVIEDTRDHFECNTFPPDYCGNHAVMVFDSSGDWAIIDIDWNSEAHILGGTPDFIQEYYDAAGGEHYVRAWRYLHEFGNTETVWDQPYPSEWQLAHYNKIGWPPPIYPDATYKSGSTLVDWEGMFGGKIKARGYTLRDVPRY